MKRTIGTIAISALATLVAGCGSGNGSRESEATATTPQEAIVQITEVREGLDDAMATYANGNAKAAGEQVGTTYLEHFEQVEGPLDKADHELNEHLEDAIREELRNKMKANAPKGEVQSLADEIKADLAKAEAALR